MEIPQTFVDADKTSDGRTYAREIFDSEFIETVIKLAAQNPDALSTDRPLIGDVRDVYERSIEDNRCRNAARAAAILRFAGVDLE